MNRPNEITASHLARRAVVYVRQSTEVQVLKNQGSTAAQRAQRQHAEVFGWAADLIHVVDEDLGLSGTGATHRRAYLQLVEDVKQGLVGAVFVSDITRAGREAIEWFQLLDLCRRRDVLVIVDGKAHNLRDDADLLLMRLVTTIGEHENTMRRATMMRGRYAKARMGKAVSRPPAGYIWQPDGTWIMDPDPSARAAITALFREFFRCRSLPRTACALRAQGIKLPRRKGGMLSWVEATIGRVARVLHHPAYKGEYHFGVTRLDLSKEKSRKGRPATRAASPEEIVVTHGHHEPYITPAQFEEIQQILRTNAPSPDRRNLGPGCAILQGLLRHALHEKRAMGTRYLQKRLDGRYPYRYCCPGDHDLNGIGCISAPGPLLDAAVVDAVREKVRPPSVEAIRDAWRQARTDERAEEHRRQTELNHLRQKVADLEYRYFSVDPANRLVARDLESKLEAAKRDLDRAERLAIQETPSAVPFDDAAFEELLSLCQDFSALWSAATTEYRDRKEIVRILVRHVVVEDYDPEHVHMRIVWTDGGEDTPLTVNRQRHGHRIARRLAEQGYSPRQIAERLNEMGIRTQQDRQWVADTVRIVLRARRDRGEQKRGAA